MDKLFFAVRPCTKIVPALDATAIEAAYRHGLHSEPLCSVRYHISLQPVAALEGVPGSLLEKADRAARQVDLPAFDIRFDSIMSFNGRQGKYALVLAGCLSSDMQALYLQLGAAMRTVGLRSHDGPFVPHVTLLYDRRKIAAEAVEPVGWRVNSFCLIDSLQGRSIHKETGCWPLRG